MGPKAFVTCYVCFREFGSRSIPFHEPKCLERWRASNRALPPAKRSPTPVKPIGWKDSTETTWICTNCQVSVPAAKRGEHAAACFGKNRSNISLLDKPVIKTNMAADKGSPRKGKENKNNYNNNNNDMNAKNNMKNNANNKNNVSEKNSSNEIGNESNSDKNNNETTEKTAQEFSTSHKSVRPQTKILRRPTPNLKHPVIPVEAGDNADSPEKSKEENPKRLKTNDGNSSEHKPKNFIMYNKYNVEKNIKNSPKERSAPKEVIAAPAVGIASIPYPCKSCSRSIAPERLHSHSRRDARGMMLKKSQSIETSKSSPHKKLPEVEEKTMKEIKEDAKEKMAAEKSVGEKKNAAPRKGDTPRVAHVCYICRREFGVTSLPLHEQNCLERWKRENELLSPSRRKSLPQKPAQDDKAESSDPVWQAVQAQLVPCPSCGRTFFPERLPVHQRVCKVKPNPGALARTSSLREQSASHGDEDGDKATIYVRCYICGRSFGSWVIPMHESQCLRKWRRDNEKLPEHLQQQEPHKPQLVLTDDGQAEMDATGDMAWESHLQQLVPCPRCGRTFFPDRLQVHERSCKGPDRHPRSNKGA